MKRGSAHWGCDNDNRVINRTMLTPTTYRLSLLNVRGMVMGSRAPHAAVTRRIDHRRESAVGMVVGWRGGSKVKELCQLTVYDICEPLSAVFCLCMASCSGHCGVSRRKGFRLATTTGAVSEYSKSLGWLDSYPASTLRDSLVR